MNTLRERNRIHNTDLITLCEAQANGSIDLILCDLPYGALTHIEWDVMPEIDALWYEFNRIIKPGRAIVLTATQPFTSVLTCSNMDGFRHEWIWEKPQGTQYLNANRQPLKNHESILVFSSEAPLYNPQMRPGVPYKTRRGAVGGFVRDKELGDHTTVNNGERYPVTVLRFDRETGLHPTQKPVKLFEYLIKTYSNEGDLVLDPCVGSGTTAVAARNTGRDFICGDLTEHYVKLARQRVMDTDAYRATKLSDEIVQFSLFDSED